MAACRNRRRLSIALCLAVVAALCAAVPARAAGPLTATPASAQVGSPITFTGFAPAAVAPSPFRLEFGDGANVAFVQPAFSFVHVYARAGEYTARLSDARNATLGTAAVTIGQPAFQPGRAPIGRIYTTSLTIPSVLAGGETAIVVRYALGDATYAAAGAPLLAYVELRTDKGALIRRSDPFEIITAARGGLQSAVIPYSVPVDAGGSYALRVVLRAAGGGTVATSDALPLLVAAGPDPQPELHTEFRASGALEVGPNAVTGASFNPGAVVALQWPTHSLSLTGLFDPVSHRPDPVLMLESRMPGAVQNPDAAATATPAAATPGPPASFKDTLGRTTSALPPVLGDGTTLRGLDASRTVGSWVLHGAYGYAQLAAPGIPAERAGIIDVTRTLGAGNLRSRQSNATAQLNLNPSAQTQVSIGVRRDTLASSTVQITTDQLNAGLGTAVWGGQLSVNGSLVGLRDALTAANASATRTATVQFARQRNAHTLGVGFTGTSVTGASPNAQTGESLTYGFPLGGRVVDGALLHGFELEFALTNTNATSASSTAVDQARSAIVSYHLTKHLALGVRAESHHHSGTLPPPPGAASAIRLRLDVTQ